MPSCLHPINHPGAVAQNTCSVRTSISPRRIGEGDSQEKLIANETAVKTQKIDRPDFISELLQTLYKT